MPGFNQSVAQLPARLHQECAEPMAGSQTFRVENLFRARLVAELLQHRRQGGFDDGLR